MSAINHDSGSRDAEHSAMGSAGGGVLTTNWTVVRAAGSTDPVRARTALLVLAERYRVPVRAYLSSDGYAEAEADALADRFFASLGRRHTLRSAAEEAGSFREWLIRALEQFLGSDPDPTAPLEANADLQSESAALPTIPGYETFEVLGVGGEGTVYRAYDLRAQRQVALKVLHPQHRGDPGVVERFQKSVALASTLEHPNIVRVYDKGSPADPQPYCAMQLVLGGTLAERQRQEQFRAPETAARLVIKIARALHHAHQHGILHRDVSPANVLLDSNDEPFIADFLAKRVRQAGPSTAVGKYVYAAPELAQGDGATVEADVYGLGAVLYELWTGRPPIRANSFEEVRRQHEQGGPKPARSLIPTIPRDLDAVCRAALSRDPKQRHASAAAFADSLERALEKFPPLWPKASRTRRLCLWGCRHPLLAAGALLGALLLLAADWLTLSSVRAQQAELESGTLHGNAALASAQAQAVLSLFEKIGSEAARTATEPEVQAFLERDQLGPVHALRGVVERKRGLDSAAVFSREGRILARYPDSPALMGRSYHFRGYFQCIDAMAKRAEPSDLAQRALGVCLSSAYRGETSHEIELSVAAPVYTAGGVIGFVLLNKHAKNTLEEIEIDDAYQSGQTTALFAVRERDRDSPARDESFPKQLTVFAHPGLFRGEERALDPELSGKLLEHFATPSQPGGQLRPLRVRPWEAANYVDPVSGDRRLAGFAPVGATGFVVAVSTPRSKALGASERHVEALWRYAVLLNVGFLLLGGVALWGSLRDVAPGSRR